MTCMDTFTHAWHMLHVFYTSFDWFIGLFAPVLTGQVWFYDTQVKTALKPVVKLHVNLEGFHESGLFVKRSTVSVVKDFCGEMMQLFRTSNFAEPG